MSIKIREPKQPDKQSTPRRFNYKRIILFLAVLSVVSLSTLALAATQYMQKFPVNFNPKETPEPSFTVYIEGVEWTNGTAIDFGDIDEGTSKTLEMTVVNTGNAPITVTINVDGLASGWTLTWTRDGETIAINDSKTGNLTLSIPNYQIGDPTSCEMTVTGALTSSL